MFVFACPIIANSQYWLFDQGKYGENTNIRICPEFNFRYLRSGLKVHGKMMHEVVFQSN